MEFEGKVTRFDVPVDDFSGIVPLNELKLKCLRKEYVSRMRKPNIEREIDCGDEEDEFAKEIKGGKGWSFTMGKRSLPSLSMAVRRVMPVVVSSQPPIT